VGWPVLAPPLMHEKTRMPGPETLRPQSAAIAGTEFDDFKATAAVAAAAPPTTSTAAAIRTACRPRANSRRRACPAAT
jgi:hypothetical protein